MCRANDYHIDMLVGGDWNMIFYLFFPFSFWELNVIIPIDELTFFRGVGG